MWEELPPDVHIVGVGDFNGDGLTDLLLRSADGTITDWLATSDGGFADNAGNLTVNVDPSWHVVGVGPINNDGLADILWRNDSGAIFDFVGTPNGGVANNGDNSWTAVSSNLQLAAIGDFNGDGRDDILWRDASGTITQWLSTPTGGFTDNSANSVVTVGLDWQVAGTGDFNGDGYADILWRNADGAVFDFLGSASGGEVNNGDASWTAGSSSAQVAGIGDFNGDGRADILWREADGSITDWLGQASGGFADNSAVASQPLDAGLHVAAVGDFNGDGRADMLLQAADGTLETWNGAANGALLSPTEQVWQQAVSNVGYFMQDFQDALASSGSGGGGETQTYVDDGQSHLGIDGWVTSNLDVPVVEMGIGGDVFQNLVATTDSGSGSGTGTGTGSGTGSGSGSGSGSDTSTGFHIVWVEGEGFSAAFEAPDGVTGLSTDNFGSMTLIDSATNTFSFDMNGIELIGDYHEGTPVANDPNAIIITGARIGSNGNFVHAGYFEFNPHLGGWNFTDGHGGGGGSAATPISAAARQAVIDKLSSDSKFWAFQLNGVDIDHAILNAIATDTIIFSDVGLTPGEDAFTNAGLGTIQVATAFENDPVALAVLLAHEGLHQALYTAVAPSNDSVYAEALGKLVSAYVYTGLSVSDQTAFRNDVNPLVHNFFNETNYVVGLSNQGNFQGILNYAQKAYPGLDMYPPPQVYDKIKGSFGG